MSEAVAHMLLLAKMRTSQVLNRGEENVIRHAPEYRPPVIPLSRVPQQHHVPLNLNRFIISINSQSGNNFAETRDDAYARIFPVCRSLDQGLRDHLWMDWTGKNEITAGHVPHVFHGFVCSSEDRNMLMERRRLASVKSQWITDWTCARVWTEVMILKSVRHENISALFETFVVRHESRFTEYDWFMVFEHANAGDLGTEISRYDPVMSDAMVRKYANQICSGVKALHAKRIAHLNLSPETILIKYNKTQTKRCLISDFSCAMLPDRNGDMDHADRAYDVTSVYNIIMAMLHGVNNGKILKCISSNAKTLVRHYRNMNNRKNISINYLQQCSFFLDQQLHPGIPVIMWKDAESQTGHETADATTDPMSRPVTPEPVIGIIPESQSPAHDPDAHPPDADWWWDTFGNDKHELPDASAEAAAVVPEQQQPVVRRKDQRRAIPVAHERLFSPSDPKTPSSVAGRRPVTGKTQPVDSHSRIFPSATDTTPKTRQDGRKPVPSKLFTPSPQPPAAASSRQDGRRSISSTHKRLFSPSESSGQSPASYGHRRSVPPPASQNQVQEQAAAGASASPASGIRRPIAGRKRDEDSFKKNFG